ncbi:MAG: response regulator [Chitinispirillaceae bacterium]|nr:response regulator [Chitinispirillaceae bacterium]
MTENKNQQISSENGNTKTILVVDDDEVTVDFMCLLIQYHIKGVTLIKGKNGEEALRLIKQHSPHLLILNLIMPGKSGFDVLEELSHCDKNFPLFLRRDI